MLKLSPFLILIVLVACKQESTHVRSIDSTSVHTEESANEVKSPPSADSVGRRDTIAFERGMRLLPVDNAAKDQSFLLFREHMLRVVKARDASELISLLDTNIRLSFGGESGVNDFRKMWKPEERSSKLWTELEWILTHGGDFRGESPRTFWAPYVYSNWPDKGLDAFEHAVVTGEDVAVYEKPDVGSREVARLSYHFVRPLDGAHLREDPPEYVQIRTPEGTVGYVKSDSIRSSLDYRAGFEKRKGGWKMTVLIAGD